MITSPHDTVEMHSGELALYDDVVAAARNVVLALGHGRDPSRASVKELQNSLAKFDGVPDSLREKWDEHVREN